MNHTHQAPLLLLSLLAAAGAV
ncbi:MAG: hypothetical protein RL385_4294, partial [Pseudomonadota bacterium]